LSQPDDDDMRRPQAEPNIQHVVLGNLLIKCWYPSFYPDEMVGRGVERLYVCQWCFRYSQELMPYLAHVVRRLLLTDFLRCAHH